MPKNKAYLQGHYYSGARGAARDLLDLPRHIAQVDLIAVAPSKAAVIRMLEEHFGHSLLPSWHKEMRVNDGFTPWRELSDQGILSLDQQGVWMTQHRSRILVAMLPGGRAEVVTRGERVDSPPSGPAYVCWAKA